MIDNLGISLKRSVPVKDLRDLVIKYDNTNYSYRSTKDDLINQLQKLQKVTPSLEDELNKLLENYKFGGKGSRTWGIPLEPKIITKDELTRLISNKFENDPFL